MAAAASLISTPQLQPIVTGHRMSSDLKDFRRIASFAPYDFVEILVNNHTYGGGGIFNLYATVAADSDWSPYVFRSQGLSAHCLVCTLRFRRDTCEQPYLWRRRHL